jgi:hypothetical protein
MGVRVSQSLAILAASSQLSLQLQASSNNLKLLHREKNNLSDFLSNPSASIDDTYHTALV